MGWPGPMTHRQFLAWRAWLAMEWDRPSRSDHYLMQIASETIRPHLKKGAKVRPGDYKLSFTGTGAKKKERPAQTLEENKAVWLQATAGMKGVKYVPGPAERKQQQQGQ